MKEFFPVEISSAEEMQELGNAVAKGLAAGDVIAVTGNLGAGKTHLSKGIAQGLGFEGEVTSPTFSLVQEYEGNVPIFHFDFYRMKAVDEVLDIGWDDYLESGGVVIVEWADMFAELLPEGCDWIHIEIVGEARSLSYRDGL